MINIKSAGKHISNSPATGILLLISLAFSMGVLTYLVFARGVLPLPEKAFTGLGTISPAAGCIVLLIFLSMSAFSVIGIFIIPVTDYFLGVFSAVCLASITPDTPDIFFILKAGCVLFSFLLLGAMTSVSSAGSSLRLFLRSKGDKQLRSEYIKLFLICTAGAVTYFVCLRF